MNTLRRLLFIVVASLLFILNYQYLRDTYAAEVSAPNRVLISTQMKTESTGLFISTTPVSAFTTTFFQCPVRNGTCTIRVEVSSQFNGIGPPDPNVAAVIVSVDGSTSGVLPGNPLGFDSTSTGGGSNVRTFSWITTNLTYGQHYVDVQFYVTAGSASSANRALTIDVYKP